MLVTLKPVKQKRNAKEWPEFYSCNFLTPGLVGYQDVGAGTAWLSKETILKMLPSFQGKPVVMNHVDVTPKSYESHAVGYITKVWFDDYTNWACCNFILTDDKAKEAIAKGYSVSCAYDQCVTDPMGGEKNAVPYDEEILSGVGNHLALVTSPRYEEARVVPLDCMMLVNSKRAVIKEGEGKKNNSFQNGQKNTQCNKCGRKFISTPAGRGNCPDCDSSDVRKISNTVTVRGATVKPFQNTVIVKVSNDVDFEKEEAGGKKTGDKVTVDGEDGIVSDILKDGRIRVRLKSGGFLDVKPPQAAKRNKVERICDSCEYLCGNHCDVAGEGGEITLEYAGKRLLGLVQDCSAYEKKAGGRRENFATVKVSNSRERAIADLKKAGAKITETNIAYEMYAQKMEAEGMSRSDAQAAADVKYPTAFRNRAEERRENFVTVRVANKKQTRDERITILVRDGLTREDAESQADEDIAEGKETK